MFRDALSRARVVGARLVARDRGLDQTLGLPVDDPRIHVAGPDPDRLLFFGTGPIAGPGVSSHRSSITGQASRQIAALTGRGVDAEVYSDITLTIRTAISALQKIRLGRFDAIVVAIGINDALLGTGVKAWTSGLGELLDTVQAGIPASGSVFFMGISDPADSPLFRRVLSRGASMRSHALNRASRRVIASRPSAMFVDFSAGPPESGTHIYTAESHARWAGLLAAPVAAALDHVFAAGARYGAYSTVAEKARQSAVEKLGLLDTPAEDRFDRITRMASVLLKTQSAVFALIDDERVWFKSAVGVEVTEVDRAASFCRTTITQRGGLEVDDASRDARFATSPLVTGEPRLRFYVGYPVESADGLPVGVLCAFDSTPRRSEPESLSTLRDLALLVQAELAR
jgi:hypothetical protein